MVDSSTAPYLPVAVVGRAADRLITLAFEPEYPSSIGVIVRYGLDTKNPKSHKVVLYPNEVSAVLAFLEGADPDKEKTAVIHEADLMWIVVLWYRNGALFLHRLYDDEIISGPVYIDKEFIPAFQSSLEDAGREVALYNKEH